MNIMTVIAINAVLDAFVVAVVFGITWFVAAKLDRPSAYVRRYESNRRLVDLDDRLAA
jgi:hypothetical protein